MPKIKECDRCQFYSHHYALVCALHPTGAIGKACSDFTPNPELEGKRFKDFLGLQWTTSEELSHLDTPIDNPFSLDPDENWSPPGTRFVSGELVIERDEPSYYNGELIRQPRQQLTPEQQLELLDTHPAFTGKCPECGYQFSQDNPPPIHWDCPECGWMDDTV